MTFDLNWRAILTPPMKEKRRRHEIWPRDLQDKNITSSHFFTRHHWQTLQKTICFRDVRTLIEKHFKIQFHGLEVHEPRDKRGPMNVDIHSLCSDGYSHTETPPTGDMDMGSGDHTHFCHSLFSL